MLVSNTVLTTVLTIIPIVRQSLAQSCTKDIGCTDGKYCSPFSERCEKCSDICDRTSHNFHESDCNRYCLDYGSEDDLRSEVRAMQHQQNVIYIVVILLLILVIATNGIKFIQWIQKQRFIKMCCKKLSSRKKGSSKEAPIGVISNVMHINEIDRPPSQVFSISGMEGSTVLTVTTPVSGRYPAEDSTSSVEGSYDNPGLQVTPSSSKPSFPRI